MGEVVIVSVDQGLKDLFRWVYTENCEIECNEMTETDRNTIEDLDSFEVLENLKDLFRELLDAKRELKKTDKGELIARCEQFESQLQKLENDVRNHIRVSVMKIQQELKLSLDAAQSCVEELHSASTQLELMREALSAKDKELQDLRTHFSPTLELLAKDSADHRRILSLRPLPADNKKPDLYKSSERRHKSVIRLDAGLVKGEVKASDADAVQPLPAEIVDAPRLISHAQPRFHRALSERQQDVRRFSADSEAGISKKPAASPYRVAERTHSKARITVSPLPRNKHHTRTISDKLKRPTITVRSFRRV